MVRYVTYNKNNLLYTKCTKIYYTVKSIVTRFIDVVVSLQLNFNNIFDNYLDFVRILFMGPNSPPDISLTRNKQKKK